MIKGVWCVAVCLLIRSHGAHLLTAGPAVLERGSVIRCQRLDESYDWCVLSRTDGSRVHILCPLFDHTRAVFTLLLVAIFTFFHTSRYDVALFGDLRMDAQHMILHSLLAMRSGPATQISTTWK